MINEQTRINQSIVAASLEEAKNKDKSTQTLRSESLLPKTENITGDPNLFMNQKIDLSSQFNK